jgi:hypothetical protein
MTSFGSNDQARALICESPENAAHARKAPSRATTATVSPGLGSPSTLVDGAGEDPRMAMADGLVAPGLEHEAG